MLILGSLSTVGDRISGKIGKNTEVICAEKINLPSEGQFTGWISLTNDQGFYCIKIREIIKKNALMTVRPPTHIHYGNI